MKRGFVFDWVDDSKIAIAESICGPLEWESLETVQFKFVCQTQSSNNVLKSPLQSFLFSMQRYCYKENNSELLCNIQLTI